MTRQTCVTVLGVAALLAALALPWFYGATGWSLALGEGTLWPLRLVAAIGPLLALAALAQWRRWLAPELVLALAGFGVGALVGFALYWEVVGAGFAVSALGTLAVLASTYRAATARTGEMVGGAVGAGIVGYELLGPLDPAYLFAGGAVLAGGLWMTGYRHRLRVEKRRAPRTAAR